MNAIASHNLLPLQVTYERMIKYALFSISLQVLHHSLYTPPYTPAMDLLRSSQPCQSPDLLVLLVVINLVIPATHHRQYECSST